MLIYINSLGNEYLILNKDIILKDQISYLDLLDIGINIEVIYGNS